MHFSFGLKILKKERETHSHLLVTQGYTHIIKLFDMTQCNINHM